MLAIPQTLLEDRRRRRSLTLRFGSRKALGSGLFGLAVLVALLWGVHLAGQPDLPEGVSPQRAALIEALGPVRPFEGRLVGFEYAPVKPLPEGWRTKEIAAAIRAIDDETELRPSPRALADAAVADLLHNRFDSAVARLKKAASEDRDDATIYSDLAAALLARGVAEIRPYDVFRGLAAAQKATLIQQTLPEAQFNLTLALDLLGVKHEAIEIWQGYLKIDPDSKWADEIGRASCRERV